MSTQILMPALSPTMTEGKLARWLKKVGDDVRAGDVIAEIETDKATMEVEAVDEGVLAKIVVPEGSADVPVNQLIALIAEEGEDVAGITAAAAAPAAPKAEAPATAPKADDMVLREERPDATPGAAPSAPASQSGGQVGGQGGRIVASPLARRLAKQLGLDLSDIAGSGPHGRIIERDVREAEKAGPKPKSAPAAPPSAPAAAPAPVAASDESIRKMFEPGSYETVPHDGMRKTIARRLVEAKQTIPHFYLTVDCQLDALLALRGQINKAAPEKDGKPAYKISVNDMIIKALAMALQRVPEANATWTEGAMLRHTHSDVGVAVSIPGGLITPVVRKAETKTLSVISNEMKDFAARAKNRKLKPEEYTGGSTAVSNLGMFGIKDFAAVINPPHATILAVGAGEQRVVVKDGAPAVATIMSVTLSTDHRAVDGALGAQLLDAFKRLIEAPMGMLV
jgi:pyruvate dehydrogenase E2 component (dihydrolipoamide acetyltransferase)